MSSDPSNQIPISLLEKAIKLTNEPPQGVKPNMKRAFVFFTKEEFDDKEQKVKTILFGLCYFHAVMLERKKFGAKGWNGKYPFSIGDLRDSAIVLNNYLEQNASSGKIPWDDLRYIFGEIMYGGHIVDDWDRIMCAAFLQSLMRDEILDDATELFPFIEGKGISFKSPPPLAYDKYIEHIEVECPPETPLAYGMHPNAEIDFRTVQCLELFKTLQEIRPKDAGAGGEGGGSIFDEVNNFISKVEDDARLEADKCNIEDINSKLGDETRGPYACSFLQECEYMNVLITVILKSLGDIKLAQKGELTLTEGMEALMACVNLGRVPPLWTKYGFVSSRPLYSWLDNIKHRLEQLKIWESDPTKIPTVVFLNRLFNPQSFLTAIK